MPQREGHRGLPSRGGICLLRLATGVRLQVASRIRIIPWLIQMNGADCAAQDIYRANSMGRHCVEMGGDM
jgi:hypothetical protein